MSASIAVYSALGAAACFGVGNALQHRSARRAPATHFLRPRLVGHLLTRPQWLLGTTLAAVGLGLHVLALDLGQLAVVQPLLVTSLLFALPAAAVLDRRRVSRTELFWASLTLGGLIISRWSPHRARPATRWTSTTPARYWCRCSWWRR